jgi:hypothetical protein
MTFARKMSALLAMLSPLLMAPIAGAQTSITSPTTINTSGSYILGGNINGSIVITGSKVLLDLNGFGINASGGGTCNITLGTPGNSCTGATSGSPALTISGNGVIVKNGNVRGGPNDGIQLSAGISANSNVTLQDINVSNFVGNCINASSQVVTLINVQANQCGRHGIAAAGGLIATNVQANYNNNNGINESAHAILNDIMTTYNKATGLATNGTVNHVVSFGNGSMGVFMSGTLKDAYAYANVSDGINVSGGFGVVLDSISTQNGGNGFTMTSSTCYWGLSSNSNTGTQISGGTALTGSTASCL